MFHPLLAKVLFYCRGWHCWLWNVAILPGIIYIHWRLAGPAWGHCNNLSQLVVARQDQDYISENGRNQACISMHFRCAVLDVNSENVQPRTFNATSQQLHFCCFWRMNKYNFERVANSCQFIRYSAGKALGRLANGILLLLLGCGIQVVPWRTRHTNIMKTSWQVNWNWRCLVSKSTWPTLPVRFSWCLWCDMTQVLIALLYFFSEERMQDPYEEVETSMLAQESNTKIFEVWQVCPFQSGTSCSLSTLNYLVSLPRKQSPPIFHDIPFISQISPVNLWCQAGFKGRPCARPPL